MVTTEQMVHFNRSPHSSEVRQHLRLFFLLFFLFFLLFPPYKSNPFCVSCHSSFLKVTIQLNFFFLLFVDSIYSCTLIDSPKKNLPKIIPNKPAVLVQSNPKAADPEQDYCLFPHGVNLCCLCA